MDTTETLTLDAASEQVEEIRAAAAIRDWEAVRSGQRRLYAAALRAIAAGAPGAVELARAALEAESRPGRA